MGAPSIVIKPEFAAQFAQALSDHRVIVFSAPCGTGKTCVAHALLRHQKALFRTASADDCLDLRLNPLPKNCSVFVLDDLQELREKPRQEALCSMIREERNITFLLLSRGAVPGWLLPFRYAGLLESFDTRFFQLDRATSQKMLETAGAAVSPTEMTAIQNDIQGYGIAMAALCRLKQGGEPYSPAMLGSVKRELFAYLTEAVFRRFPSPLRRLLLSVAPFETFTTEMAAIVSGDSKAGELVGSVVRDTTMMTFDNINTYRIYPIFREFLLWQLMQEYTSADQRAIYNRAGLYYEIHDDVAQALQCYSNGKDSHKVSELLIKQAELHPGLGHYYEVESYYRSLPEAEILRSPALMCCMSMLCAMTMDFEGSQRWYEALQNYAVRLTRSDAEYKEVRSRLAYLDIALPQRSSKGLVELFGSLYTIMKDKQLTLPSFSVTSMLPSVMNGGKDFCSWSLKDDLLYHTMRPAMELVLGRDGVCLAECAICESKFEKGEEVSERLLNLISRLGEVQRNGTPDMEFAIVGLLARSQIAKGRAQAAKNTLETLRIKFTESGQNRFLPNIDAMLCRIALRVGDADLVDAWYSQKAPRDPLMLRAMWRYQYLTCAMVEISHGEYEQALLVLAPLIPYCTACGRILDGIYIDLLTAICRWHMHDERWQPALERALEACRTYRFIRPVDQFGDAILPLLTDCTWQTDPNYLQQLMSATRLQAILYPDFLHPASTLAEPLSAAELQVLKLVCSNRTNQEICVTLNIKLPTVKTHVSHILQKLGVKRRSEAKHAAETLHLV